MCNLTETVIDESLDDILFAVTLIFSLVICSANSLTIIIFYRTAVLRTLANLYVVSLAFVDLLVGLSMILLSLFMLPSTRVLLYNRHIYICVFIISSDVGMTANSLVHMTIISVDRYLYIVKPYFYQRFVSVRSVAGLIAAAWGIALCYTTPPFFVFRNNGPAPNCGATLLLPRWYMFYFAWTGYFTCALVILALYLLVVRTTLKHHKRICAGAMISSRTRGPTTSYPRPTLKSLKLFVTVFGVFFACITPMVLCMGLDYIVNTPIWLYRCLLVLALLNSGMNFVILTAQNRPFRDQLKKLCQRKGRDQ